MKTKANSEFHIKDLGDRVEMTTTLFLGLINGVQYLAKEGYDIIEDACMGKGLMYVVTAYKPKEDNQIDEIVPIDFESLTKKDELLKYADMKGYEVPSELKLPSQIKKYIKDLEEG